MVTRAPAQAADTTRLLRRQGANVRIVPLIETIPLDDPAPLDRALASATRNDWIVFTSANGVDQVLARLRATGRSARALMGPHVAAIGPGTEGALLRAGLGADLIASDHVAEGLARALIARGIAKRHILILRARIARPVLEEQLRAAGAIVTVAPAYQTRPSASGARRLRGLLNASPEPAAAPPSGPASPCVIALASASAADALHAVARGRIRAGIRLAAIGPVTAGRARALGYRVSVVARVYTAQGLAQALAHWWSRNHSPTLDPR